MHGWAVGDASTTRNQDRRASPIFDLRFAFTPELSYEINDVDSCYPSMPKEAMQVAMRDILRNVRKNLPPGAGEDPKILVPKRGKKKCSWAQEGEVRVD